MDKFHEISQHTPRSCFIIPTRRLNADVSFCGSLGAMESVCGRRIEETSGTMELVCIIIYVGTMMQ